MSALPLLCIPYLTTHYTLYALYDFLYTPIILYNFEKHPTQVRNEADNQRSLHLSCMQWLVGCQTSEGWKASWPPLSSGMSSYKKIANSELTVDVQCWPCKYHYVFPKSPVQTAPLVTMASATPTVISTTISKSAGICNGSHCTRPFHISCA